MYATVIMSTVMTLYVDAASLGLRKPCEIMLVLFELELRSWDVDNIFVELSRVD